MKLTAQQRHELKLFAADLAASGSNSREIAAAWNALHPDATTTGPGVAYHLAHPEVERVPPEVRREAGLLLGRVAVIRGSSAAELAIAAGLPRSSVVRAFGHSRGWPLTGEALAQLAEALGVPPAAVGLPGRECDVSSQIAGQLAVLAICDGEIRRLTDSRINGLGDRQKKSRPNTKK